MKMFYPSKETAGYRMLDDEMNHKYENGNLKVVKNILNPDKTSNHKVINEKRGEEKKRRKYNFHATMI